MSTISPIELKTSEVVEISPEKFNEIFVAGKAKKGKQTKSKSLPKKRSQSKSRKMSDYCFNCKSLTENVDTSLNGSYRLSKCSNCKLDKKAFVNPT
jgi:hypothetical protein